HYLYSNLVGNEAGRAIYDGGALVASAGQLVAAGPRFSYADYGVTSALVDIDAARLSRARTGSFTPEFQDTNDNCVAAAFTFTPNQPRPSQPLARAAWETGSSVKEEEFVRAISLALFDYMRKSRSRGFVVSISGGADSAAVSCLVAMFVQLGLAELGREGFLAKLKYFAEIQPAGDEKEIVHRLLACVYQSTRNSGQVTLNAARGVADAIGAEFFQFDVDQVVQNYIEIVSRGIGRKLSWA